MPRGIIDTLCTLSLPGRDSATSVCPISWCATTSRSCGFSSRFFFSRPATMRSTAAVKSASVTASAPRRVASKAASLTRLAKSAPVKPGVSDATVSRSTSGDILILRAWTCRICTRPTLSGRSTRTWRSKRPARNNAGSRISGRLVAQQHHPGAGVKTVQLGEQLVQRLLFFVMPAAPGIGAAGAAERVELVDKDDARRLLPRLLEQITHARGADPDKHLDEFRAVDREERHIGLAGDGSRQQRLAGPRRADQQHPFRHPAAEPAVAHRVFQERNDLL